MTAVQEPVTSTTRPRLNALVASRICHDLVGPLGAVANGLELMAMSGETSPEAQLIAQSVATATARLRFVRVAYGVASAGQVSGRAEVRSILQDVSQGGRLAFEWEAAGDHPRDEVRAVFLLLQCFETAMPLGGRVRVEREDEAWTVTGEGPSVRVDEALWRSLQPEGGPGPDAPALVHFALLQDLLEDLGRPLATAFEPNRIAARF